MTTTIKLIKSIGFDVGIRNLGCAIVTFNADLEGWKRFEVNKLMLIDTETKVTTEAVKVLCKKFDSMWETDLHDIDFVNIEQQPEKHHLQKGTGLKRRFIPSSDNTQMKSIGHALQAYFLAKGKPVRFISAKSKLTVWDGETIIILPSDPIPNDENAVIIKTKSKDAYYRRKLISIGHAQKILEEGENQYWTNWMDGGLFKKDDVCDAFLQCCYALKTYNSAL